VTDSQLVNSYRVPTDYRSIGPINASGGAAAGTGKHTALRKFRNPSLIRYQCANTAAKGDTASVPE
jgi:hypothetical protein